MHFNHFLCRVHVAAIAKFEVKGLEGLHVLDLKKNLRIYMRFLRGHYITSWRIGALRDPISMMKHLEG